MNFFFLFLRAYYVQVTVLNVVGNIQKSMGKVNDTMASRMQLFILFCARPCRKLKDDLAMESSSREFQVW